jgi:hypothetical protein
MSNRKSLYGARLAALAGALAAGAASADDVTGAEHILCTAWHAIACSTEGDCESTEAWRLSIPDFVKVDLETRQLVTPEGSEQPRQTAIGNISRNLGKLFLTGTQDDRAYSWVINEGSGEGTLAIVSDTTVISLFTACVATDNL